MRPDPKHPSVVNALIDAARSDPRAIEFLLDAPLDTAAILLGAHAFTVEAARARLRVEQPELQGPDRILMMVSTSASHMKKNFGLDHAGYWAEAERAIRKAHDAGIKVNGTVSTIWGCPIEGPTRLEDAVAFTKRFLEIGADDIEHADHDGSAPPNRVHDYYSMILDAIPDPSKHVAHFHVTRGWGLANVVAALQAGIVRYESTLGGIGGQPANFFDGAPVAGTGSYYYQDPNNVGLVCTEDL